MTRTPDYLSRDGGRARYVYSEPPLWLVEAVPGAAEAREEWLALNAASRPLMAEHRDAIAARRALDRTATVDEREAADRAVSDALRAIDTNGRRALTAAARFDAIVNAPEHAETRRRTAARVALDEQARAEEALATLTEALAERDRAWRLAGSPGRDVRHLAPGSLSPSLATVRGFVEHFDTRATTDATEADVEPEDVPGDREITSVIGGTGTKRRADAARIRR